MTTKLAKAWVAHSGHNHLDKGVVYAPGGMMAETPFYHCTLNSMQFKTYGLISGIFPSNNFKPGVNYKSKSVEKERLLYKVPV